MEGVLSSLSEGNLKNVDSQGSLGPKLWVLSPVEDFSVPRKLGLWEPSFGTTPSESSGTGHEQEKQGNMWMHRHIRQSHMMGTGR